MAGKIKDLTPRAIDALSKNYNPDSLTPGLSIAVLGSGKNYRRLPGGDVFLKRTLGPFPARSIADARAWARERSAKDEAARAAALRATMIVARVHELYMAAVAPGPSVSRGVM